jgi:2-haloacid dehalogenase
MKLDAFPDARKILQELKRRGQTTAILSNGTPAMLAAAVAAADIELDAVLSVDAIRMYKPRPEVYAMVTRHFDISPTEIVFVSSNRWDVAGAQAFGFRTAWVNRAGMPDEYAEHPPELTARDLAGIIGHFAAG